MIHLHRVHVGATPLVPPKVTPVFVEYPASNMQTFWVFSSTSISSSDQFPLHPQKKAGRSLAVSRTIPPLLEQLLFQFTSKPFRDNVTVSHSLVLYFII